MCRGRAVGPKAVTTALNAVNKLAVVFAGGAYLHNPGPIDQWEALKPMAL
jgi:tryptophan 2-monooxygenase